ncbi:GhoT/OrtT family toxin [Edaphovirga cremea]|uniref:GhoT/OrtT family toxin n=1 Tax=Edaphovirga cremea TaxID=2267246 RepID=UPI00398914DA
MVSVNSTWDVIKTVYFFGFAFSVLFTLLVSRDNSFLIRLFTSTLIGLTWPLSLPVVLLFSLF